MYQLDSDVVAGWKRDGRYWCPTAVNTYCGHCGEKGTFTLRLTQYPAPGNKDPRRWGFIGTGACPSCGDHVTFVVFQPGASDDRSQTGCECLAMFPAPLEPRAPIKGHDLLPGELRAQYSEALHVFNAGAWRATATVCRVTLEAIVAELTPDATGTLYSKLEQLAKRSEVAKPLHDLADLVRKTGNLGAHYDPNNTITPEIADACLQLTEYFLEYVGTLPRLVSGLQSQLDALNDQ